MQDILPTQRGLRRVALDTGKRRELGDDVRFLRNTPGLR
jgi:hypothetical protein